jgi:hypothetical protein
LKSSGVDDGTAQGILDRAPLVVGFTGALRPSELMALDVEDVRSTLPHQG